jgi:PKD repeat protein/glucose/arabinose dehydrogenase
VAHAATLPAGFQESNAFTGLSQPMAVEFAPTGRVFVAEKRGVVKTFANLADSSATEVVDLRTKVHNYVDRGLMSIAVDPDFPAEPYIYVYYVHDAAIGGTAPRWGQPDQNSDTCPTPPGGLDDGCVVSGRLSRIQISGEIAVGPEQVLLEDWCQQYPSHAGGGLEFGADGYLYLSGGDGASYTFVDYGQEGDPPNPCGDPPGGVGTPLSPPRTQGGKLRSQDARSMSDPLGLSGSVIRIDPDTGAGVPGNPNFTSTDPNERRMIAYGLRNAFHLAIKPGTNEVWIGDVGQADWEEINRVPAPFVGLRNFGWPCYEGGLDGAGAPKSVIHQPIQVLDITLCNSLYIDKTASPPYWAYHHNEGIVAGENCLPGGSSISALAFAPGDGNFPVSYHGALFFGDFSRDCIWVLRAGADGLPDPATKQLFAQSAGFPVDLEFGPNGELFYASIGTGTIKRVNFTGNPGNSPPSAIAAASPQSGGVPLEVSFDATASSDPNPGEVLSYAWDLDDDGELDDSTSAAPTHTYTDAGIYTATLRVTDTSGAFDEDTVTIGASDTPPQPTIDTPAAGTTWGVGQPIDFTGSATDAEDGALPDVALDWELILHHCTAPGSCHEHSIESYEHTAGGTFVAPDHDYPAHLELRLTATDAHDNETTVSRELDPRTVQVTATSDPPGMTVALDSESGPAPISATVIEGSANTLSAPSPQTSGNVHHEFSSWSDGQPQTHNARPTSDTVYTARYTPLTPGVSTLTFTPWQDAYVDEASPGTNFGSATTLRTEAGEDPDTETYLRFLVDGLLGKIESAKLRLFSTGETVDGPAIFATSNAWSEPAINWSNKPAPAGPALSDSGPIPEDTWTEWDVTGTLTGEGPASFLLASASSDGVSFHSRESAPAERRPELVLTVVNDSYPRPAGAGPVRVSLVPAYEPCTSGNRMHGSPLDHPSCKPPVRASALTVGTPEVNLQLVRSTGRVKLTVVPGIPGTSTDEADVAVALTLTDVRNTDLSDYAGQVQMRGMIRITDRATGTAGTESGTLGDLELPVNAACGVTPESADGSTCSVNTTLDAVVAGVVDEGERSVWELGQIEVLDGGPDGDPDTPGNGVFARQGVFVP